MILYPGDRPERRRLRPPGARRDGERHRVQRRSGGAGARIRRARVSPGCMSSISTAPSPARSVNGEAVRAIRRAVDLRIQLGGGIRDRAAIDRWLDLGIDRVVLGTAALRDPGAGARGRGRLPRPHRRRHRRARRQGRGRGLGRDQRDRRRRSRPALCRCRRRRDRLYRYRARRRAGRRRCRRRSPPSPARSACRSSPRAGSRRSPTSPRSQPHAEDGIAGAICGRALYDGRIDPKAALLLAAGEAMPC